MGIRSWIVAIALASVSAQVFAASFPCYKASTYAEVAVCSDNFLSHQDEELAALYQNALARLPDPKSVQWVQKNWLQDDRDKCRTVQCVKDSYTKRIAALYSQLGERAPYSSERSEPTPRQPSHAQVAATPVETGPSDEECENLNAAVKTALNSKIPAASLTQFGGRVVTGWRQSDYDAFLIAVTACSSRETVAPEISVFTDEARMLLTTLRQRAVRVGMAEPPTAQPTEARTTPANEGSASAAQDVMDWQFQRNPKGAILSSSSRAATIYIGKSCDATSPQYGNGSWEYSNAGWRVSVGDKTFAFPRMVPPVVDEQGSPPTQCEAGMEKSAAAAVAVEPVAQPAPIPQPTPVQQHPAPPAPVVRSAPVPSVASTPMPVQASAPATTTTAPTSVTNAAVGNVLAVLLAIWLAIVLIGIVAGFKGAIVVYRNFDDLAIVFFMGVILIVGGLAGFYLAGFKDSFATPLVWGLSGLGLMCLFGWTLARTWRDQSPNSVWRFGLALVTKMSLGILFLNNLVTLISPGGKTFGARSRARGSALLFLAVLTPIVMRLVREHDGVWAPHNLVNGYQRRRMGA